MTDAVDEMAYSKRVWGRLDLCLIVYSTQANDDIRDKKLKLDLGGTGTMSNPRISYNCCLALPTSLHRLQ